MQRIIVQVYANLHISDSRSSKIDGVVERSGLITIVVMTLRFKWYNSNWTPNESTWKTRTCKSNKVWVDCWKCLPSTACNVTATVNVKTSQSRQHVLAVVTEMVLFLHRGAQTSPVAILVDSSSGKSSDDRFWDQGFFGEISSWGQGHVNEEKDYTKATIPSFRAGYIHHKPPTAVFSNCWPRRTSHEKRTYVIEPIDTWSEVATTTTYVCLTTWMR